MEVLLFLTGGTIAMGKGDKGAVPAAGLDKILYKELDKTEVSIRTIFWGEKPSPHMSLEDMLTLARDIDKELAKDEAVAAVVSHGTDLLAESSFVLDLCLQSLKPVVCTGSMRHMEEAGYDGLRNILNSIHASLKMPKSSQVLLQLADKLFTARDAIKQDSVSVNPFIGQQRGNVGRITGNEVTFVQDISCQRPLLPFAPEKIENWVPIISVYPGMTESDFMRMLSLPCTEKKAEASSGADHGEAYAEPNGASGMGGYPRGLVLEAFGAGNVPPAIVKGLQKALDRGTVIVLSSRCIQGGVVPIYAYEGGGRELLDMGLISAAFLSSLKAQLLLKILLGHTYNASSTGNTSNTDHTKIIRSYFA